MAATGTMEQYAIEHGVSTEKAVEILTTKHKTIQAMSGEIDSHHATIMHWLRKYGYFKDPITGYWIKQAAEDQPQNAA